MSHKCIYYQIKGAVLKGEQKPVLLKKNQTGKCLNQSAVQFQV